MSILIKNTSIKNTSLRGFLPVDFNNGELWLDGADSSVFAFSGSNISQWRDKSGNVKHCNQAAPGSQFLYVPDAVNGLSAVSCNLGYMLGGALNISGSQAQTVLVVCSCTSTASAQIVFMNGANVRGGGKQRELNVRPASSAGNGYLFDGSNRYFNQFASSGVVASHIWTNEDGAQAQQHDRYLNGVLSTQQSSSNPTLVPSLLDEAYMLGGNEPSSPNPLFIGYLCEIVAYSDKKTAAERTILANYATAKWGI